MLPIAPELNAINGISSLYALREQRLAELLMPLCLLFLLLNISQLAHSTGADLTAYRHACEPPCESQVLYKHPQSGLTVSRYRQPHSTARRTDIATEKTATTEWRHDFDIVLTHHKGDRIVFDQYGNRHIFTRKNNGSYITNHAHSGSLHYIKKQAIWTLPDGKRYHFHGSSLTDVIDAEGKQTTLHYHDGKLNRIKLPSETQLNITHTEQGALLHSPDGQSFQISSPPCHLTPEPNHEKNSCDTLSSPSRDFLPLPALPYVSYLDARPASCQSYFEDYYGTERGSEIEIALRDHAPYNHMTHTVRSFPIVDFIDGEHLIVVRSRDLASPSFNKPESPDALLNRLMRDGAQIQAQFLTPLTETGQVQSSELGAQTTILASPDQHVTLQLIIRRDIADANQWRQITEARAKLYNRYRIRLSVVLIP